MYAMRKLFSIGVLALFAAARPATAADIPVPAYQPAPAIVLFSWSGFYIGAHGGGGWGRKETTAAPYAFGLALITPAPTTIDVSGWLAGAQIGANYQVGSWVFGAEAQASWSNLSGSAVCTGTSTTAGVATPVSGTCNVKVNALGTIAGRAGWAWDRLLVYGKGGVAWTNDKYNWESGTLLQPSLAANETRWGWMLGAGVEYAFLDSWSGKIEYNYMDLGTRTPGFTSASGLNFVANGLNSVVYSIRERISIVKLGINYRFGYTTVGVRY
jgi:outer membrane immunogenic protein